MTRWGKDPSLAEIETQRRYFDIIRSEVEQLRRIFQRGVDDKFLKPVGDMKRNVRQYLFFLHHDYLQALSRQPTWMKRSSFSSIVSFMAIATKRGSTWCTNETSKEAFLRDGLFFVFCSSRQGQYDILQV